MTYARFVRPLLFCLDPESVHSLTLRALAVAAAPGVGRGVLRRAYSHIDPALRAAAFGLGFPNPVGLAAGYDKDGVAVTGLGLLGFGHVEVGTLTPAPQAGNPRPRIFRLAEDAALINRMGFPNRGCGALNGAQLARARAACPDLRVGINLGKGNDTPNARALDDYLALLDAAYVHADYIAVNVSSPNTPGLRELQSGGALENLLAGLSARRDELAVQSGRRVPLLVKIAPDLTTPEFDAVLDAVQSAGVDGLIATNTTTARKGLTDELRTETGGLSGAPLRARSTEMIRHAYARTGGALPIVGVGGIDGANAALEKIRAGATLVQLYTGLVYRGPGLVRAINRGLSAAVQRAGVTSIRDLVGADHS